MLSLDPAVRLLQETFDALLKGDEKPRGLDGLIDEIDRETSRAEQQAEYLSGWSTECQERALNSARELKELRARVLERLKGG